MKPVASSKSSQNFSSLLIVIAIALALSVGIWYLMEQTKQLSEYSGPVEKVRLAAYAGSYGFLPFIAQEKGLFAKNGLDVEITEYDFGLKTIAPLLEDKADIATAADFVLVSYSFDHPDLRTMGSMALSLTDEVIARKDKGIEKVTDLRGKKIGVAFKTKAEFFLARFLASHHIAYSDVILVNLEPKEIIEAIEKGEIDVASIWEPNVQEIKKRLGDNAISWPAQNEQAFYYILITKEDWVKKHPQTAERFIKAMVEAEEFVKSNELEAQQIVQNKFNYDSSLVQSVIWPKNKFKMTLSEDLVSLMEIGARWRVQKNLTNATEIPDYREYIYADALKKIKPEAVTLIE